MGKPTLDEQRAQAAQAARALQDCGAYLVLDRSCLRQAIGRPQGETTVLVVEADQDPLALAELRMTLAGYGVRVADSFRGMLRSLREEGTPDLLLLDALLPDAQGLEVLARLRSDALTRSLAIVLLTAKNDPADIARGLALGADGYITKPYTRTILADAVRRILER